MNLLSTIPRYTLGFFPTPLMRLPNLEKLLGGPRLFIKRDDQTGLGLGGNKTRKLEYFMGDAFAKGADCIITAGAAQSNHCRQTAAAAAACRMECHLVLGGSAPENVNGNLLLDLLFGAKLHWSGEMRKGENIEEIAEQLNRQGKKTYIIPYGGSNETGATGFVAAMFELKLQLKSMGETISHIVFASSSGGTHSGMLLGKAELNESYHLIGINIDKDETFGMTLKEYIPFLANKTAHHLGSHQTFNNTDIDLNCDYYGKGYGVVGELEREAISLIARNQGILLDPVYTGRAMGGLLDMIRKGRFSSKDSVLFWHTGGSPALFSHADKLI
ncbi:MAG: D-cysteine desulfhydrase family protein [Pseudomonadota bacterium]